MNVEEQLQTEGAATGAATEKAKSTDNAVFQMDAEPLKVKINIFPSAEKKQEVVFSMRRPTFAEEEARERMMPLIISDAGKIDGAEASSMSLDDEGANVRMFDKIIQTVKGYSLKAGEKPSKDDVPVDTVVSTNESGEEVRSRT